MCACVCVCSDPHLAEGLELLVLLQARRDRRHDHGIIPDELRVHLEELADIQEDVAEALLRAPRLDAGLHVLK